MEINFSIIAITVLFSIFKIFTIKLIGSWLIKTLKKMVLVLDSSNDRFKGKKVEKVKLDLNR